MNNVTEKPSSGVKRATGSSAPSALADRIIATGIVPSQHWNTNRPVPIPVLMTHAPTAPQFQAAYKLISSAVIRPIGWPS